MAAVVSDVFLVCMMHSCTEYRRQIRLCSRRTSHAACMTLRCQHQLWIDNVAASAGEHWKHQVVVDCERVNSGDASVTLASRCIIVLSDCRASLSAFVTMMKSPSREKTSSG